jgi:HAE1 family hydrophobic/amphiphilic exporter-1
MITGLKCYCLRTALVAAFVLCFEGFASAQTPSPTPDEPLPIPRSFNKPLNPLPDASRVGVITGDELSLTLAQAIEMALGNNHDIEVSRKDVHIAEFNFEAANGIYDPLFNSQSYYESRTTPTASTIGGTTTDSITQRQFYGDLGLSGFVPKFGGSYDVIFNSARTTTTSRNATLNPQFPTAFTSTFTQPLWRNRSIDANRRNILIASKNIDITESQLQQKAMDIIANVEQAYWDLLYALRNFQVQLEGLQQAREQLESNQRMADKGALAPIEVVAAQAQVANFEQVVYTAQETVTRSENTLKTLVLADRTSAEWSRPLMPVTSPFIDVPHVGVEIAAAEALRNRPEIAQLETSAEINKIDEKFYRNQTKPQIDLVSSYTSAGLAGSRNPTSPGNPPESLIGGYFTSLGRIISFDFPTYRAGFQISFPIRNRTARANFGRTLVEGRRIGDQLAQAELNIEAEVRNAIQALQSAESRMQAATDARVASEELYESEQRQFRGGATTFFVVRQRLTDLAVARALELRARADLNKAISAFNRSVGATLTANNVAVSK